MDIVKLLYKYVRNSLSVIGATWSVLEILGIFFNVLKEDGCKKSIIVYVAFGAIIICILHYIFSVLFFSCKIGKGDAFIKIRYGNILKKKKGTIVVGINRELKTGKNEIGKGSIHYQIVDKELIDNCEEIFSREKNKLLQNGRASVPMGYSFSCEGKKGHYLFFGNVDFTTRRSSQRCRGRCPQGCE